MRAPAGMPLASLEPRLVLATVHGTKGLEFDHVAVVGMDDGVFPAGAPWRTPRTRRARSRRSGAWRTWPGRGRGAA